MPIRGGASVQKRIESTGVGRVVLSLVIAFTLLAVLVTNLPESELRRKLSNTTQPYLNAIGLDQNWGVFAPDPRREVLGLKGKLFYANGPPETWRPPVRGDLIGEYSDYRWQKFMENVLAEGGAGMLTRSTAGWVAREGRERSEPPVQITLTKESGFLPPPGPLADDPVVLTDSVLLNRGVSDKLLREPTP